MKARAAAEALHAWRPIVVSFCTLCGPVSRIIYRKADGSHVEILTRSPDHWVFSPGIVALSGPPAARLSGSNWWKHCLCCCTNTTKEYNVSSQSLCQFHSLQVYQRVLDRKQLIPNGCKPKGKRHNSGRRQSNLPSLGGGRLRHWRPPDPDPRPVPGRLFRHQTNCCEIVLKRLT